VDNEIKGVAERLLAGMGFPLGLIALMGAFSMGVAIVKDEISFSSKRLLFGVLLISFSASFTHLPRIYSRGYYDGTKWHWSFRYDSLIWGVGFAVATFFLAHRLLPLIR
jgi:hypothetical protein